MLRLHQAFRQILDAAISSPYWHEYEVPERELAFGDIPSVRKQEIEGYITKWWERPTDMTTTSPPGGLFFQADVRARRQKARALADTGEPVELTRFMIAS